MNAPLRSASVHFIDYTRRLSEVLQSADWAGVQLLGESLRESWASGQQVFICGNGGSAGNAIHLANDFLYGISKKLGSGLRVTALPANSAVLTCLANDVGYDAIFSMQLAVQARRGDILIVLSGSGNSPNIVRALEQALEIGMKTFAILGYSGGKCKTLAETPIHFAVDDMQIAEDLQLIVGHMLMQWLYANPPGKF
jgi:D-sedoheptulose 7-phosphate isomerase